MICSPKAVNSKTKPVRVTLAGSIARRESWKQWIVGKYTSLKDGLECHGAGYQILPTPRRGTFAECCIAGVQRCDLLFAYIDSDDCQTILHEIAVGIERGKRVVVCFSPEVEHGGYWLITRLAFSVHLNVSHCCLGAILRFECESFAKNGGDK